MACEEMKLNYNHIILKTGYHVDINMKDENGILEKHREIKHENKIEKI